MTLGMSIHCNLRSIFHIGFLRLLFHCNPIHTFPSCWFGYYIGLKTVENYEASVKITLDFVKSTSHERLLGAFS